ncbi:thermonuclease family protein [Candidatus Gottesmanbacteria bacterium]|nr:thermonuclease family protein [Candidatus Gottesmanbacteria bacterium]
MVAHKTNAMRRWIVGLVIVSTLLLAGNVYFLVKNWQRNVVVSVPDGDSLDLADGRRVRLLGIDAPERGRCMADEARAKLIDLALGRHVRLKEIVKDDFGRQLGIVIVEDLPAWLGYVRWSFFPSVPWAPLDSFDPLLNRVLVSAGLARNESTSGGSYNQVLKDAQETAKSGKLGIWSDLCRGQTSGNEDCTIKGNIRAGKKTFYLPDCPYYPDVLVDTAFGDEWFCTEKEAQSAGFTRATGCR